jgi:tetratricopeptide (TPR) repeat protein
MSDALARLALQHEDALVEAGAAALREVEDDSFDAALDIELASQDGIPVDVADHVDDPDVVARRRRCAKAAFDLFVARLRRTGVTRRELLTLRDVHGEDALLVALSEIADNLGRVGRRLEDAEIVAVHRARADARALLQSPHDVRGVATSDDVGDDAHAAGAATSPPIAIDAQTDQTAAAAAPSSQLSRALASVVDGVAVDGSDDAMAATGSAHHRAWLRLRVATVEAARALPTLADRLEAGTARHPTSPDELLVSAGGTDAVGTLIRAASTLATMLPEGAAFVGAIVAADGDAVVASVAASQHMPAAEAGACLLALDEACRPDAPELAELPGRPGVVDARTPWGQERWELSALLGRPAFRSRDDDVAACVEVLARGGDGPRALVLTGPAGVGKSSLLRAALREAGLLDHRAALMWGATDALQPTPWAAIVGMVRALARAPAGHPRAAERVDRLLDGLATFLIDAERRELLALGPTIRDLLGAADNDDDDLADRRSPRALRTALRRTVLLIGKALLARAGDDRPLVVVVSGADAMDVPTREALIFLGQHLGQRLRLVLLSSTKLKLPTTMEEVLAITRRDVRPLADRDSLAIARDLLAVDEDDVDDDLGRLLAVIVERAKGSPLHAAHATRWAVEGGAITRPPGGVGWTAVRVDDVGARLPTRVDRLLALRVQRLPSAPRQVLGHCAALGSTFMPAAVEFVGTRLGLRLDEVRRAVRLLTETGFLSRSQPRPGAPLFVDDAVADDTLLVFEHPLLRAAAEQALSDDEARAIHAVVADALEALHDARAVAARLARHHKLAGQRRRAVEHLVHAVRRARRLDDRQSAVTMATEALELVAPDEHDVTFTLQLELATALELGAAQGDKAQATLKEALKELVYAADRTGLPSRQSIALARVARFNLFLGDLDKAEAAALRALDLARSVDATADAPPHRERDVLRLLALIRFAARDLDGARRALDEARRLTPDRDERVRGGIAHQMGLLHLESNDPLGALEHLLQAIAHKRAVADLAGEAACLDAIADVYVRTGHLWTALSLLVRAIALREAIGDDAGTAQSLKNRADVLLMAGDVAAARDEAARARVRCRALGLDRLERQCAVVLARAELARRDAAAAEHILDSVRRRVDVERDPFAAMETELLSARAKWLRAQNAHGGARDRLLKTALSRARIAVELGERRGFLSGQVLGNALLGELLLAGGDVAAALPHAQRAAELLDDRTATGLAVEDALLPYIKTLQAMGDDEEARSVTARATALLEERAARLPATLRTSFWALPGRQELRTDVNDA